MKDELFLPAMKHLINLYEEQRQLREKLEEDYRHQINNLHNTLVEENNRFSSQIRIFEKNLDEVSKEKQQLKAKLNEVNLQLAEALDNVAYWKDSAERRRIE